MGAKNCWEFFGCGREPGGERTAESGVCRAAADPAFYGINGGRNGGRCCWVATGNVQDGAIGAQCLRCEFFKAVCAEQGERLKPLEDILRRVDAA